MVFPKNLRGFKKKNVWDTKVEPHTLRATLQPQIMYTMQETGENLPLPLLQMKIKRFS